MTLEGFKTPEKSPEEQTLKEISALWKVFQSTPTNENFDKLWKKINQLVKDLEIDISEITEDPEKMNKFYEEIWILVNYNPHENLLNFTNSELLLQISYDETWLWRMASIEMSESIPTLIDKIHHEADINIDENTMKNGEIDIRLATEDNQMTEKDIAEAKESVVDKGDFMETLKLIVEEEIPQMVKNEHERRSKYANMVQNKIRQSRKKISRTFENQPE